MTTGTTTATTAHNQLTQTLKLASAEGKSVQLKVVTFVLGAEEFGVDIMAVKEINRMMEITRVPQSPPEVQGVINLRGRIIPVINLRSRFGMDQGQANSESSRIVVVNVAGRLLGFTVDSVSQRTVESSTVDPAPPTVCSIDADYIAGVAKLEDRLLILLDLEKLFASHVQHGVADAA